MPLTQRLNSTPLHVLHPVLKYIPNLSIFHNVDKAIHVQTNFLFILGKYEQAVDVFASIYLNNLTYLIIISYHSPDEHQ